MCGTFVPLLLQRNDRPKKSAGGQRHRRTEMWSPKTALDVWGITCRLYRAGVRWAVRDDAPTAVKRCFRSSYLVSPSSAVFWRATGPSVKPLREVETSSRPTVSASHAACCASPALTRASRSCIWELSVSNCCSRPASAHSRSAIRLTSTAMLASRTDMLLCASSTSE
ncbi:hypothetical protein TcG_10694 [Trypanosoma cruzi]|nr:hypothetical protein TcG_10694 [Trypanosoma cruzi]